MEAPPIINPVGSNKHPTFSQIPNPSSTGIYVFFYPPHKVPEIVVSTNTL